MQHVEQLLSELESLDGAREAAVVREALAAGVAEVMVIEELQREIARRRARLQSDEWHSTSP